MLRTYLGVERDLEDHAVSRTRIGCCVRHRCSGRQWCRLPVRTVSIVERIVELVERTVEESIVEHRKHSRT
jgi:hypothetical protein